jgi:hypothetical protein
MTEPVFLSPYLRPVLEGGELLYDNGITEGRERLAPLEHQVVRALWDPIASSSTGSTGGTRFGKASKRCAASG